MRLGLYGGTFDPIHLGHLMLAEACREACGLDEVWFIVTATPPHKRGQRTEIEHRLAMARLAVSAQPAFQVSEIEAGSSGPHYSYQTIERLRLERPGDDLYFLIGADSLVDLPGWRHPERIAREARIVVVNRPGIDLETSGRRATIDLGPGAHALRFVEMPPVGISSTNLRERLREGRTIRFQVPDGVISYIYDHGLYPAPLPPRQVP